MTPEGKKKQKKKPKKEESGNRKLLKKAKRGNEANSTKKSSQTDTKAPKKNHTTSNAAREGEARVGGGRATWPQTEKGNINLCHGTTAPIKNLSSTFNPVEVS